jgi:ribonuclease P protein component
MPSVVKKISKFTKREVDHLFQHARRIVKMPACTILGAPRQKDFARILIITSRKVGNAPERNLIRRRIKSIFYEEKLYSRELDCVVIVHKEMIKLSFDQVKNLLTAALCKGSQNNESSITE